MTDRQFTHSNVGNAVRLEIKGKEVTLTFICNDEEKAGSLAQGILTQLQNGALSLTLMGKPTSVEGSLQ